MLVHTEAFKNGIKEYGKEIDVYGTARYYVNGVSHIAYLHVDNINSASWHYEGNILKSVMKQLTLDCNIELPKGATINSLKFGIKVRDDDVENYRDNYDYISHGNFIVESCEKQEDTDSYIITCYDKMILTMVDYEKMNITYPISVMNYLIAICNHLGITYDIHNGLFVNYNKMIPNEKYLSYNEDTEEWESLGYTFRDVLDELAQVTASTICVGTDEKLKVRYVADEEITPFTIEGETTQDGTPSPDNPIEIETKTGTIIETINGRDVTLDLGTMELCKIGTYQDYIYKSGDNWYKKAYIGKVVLDGSENYWNDTPSGFTRFGTDISNMKVFSSRNIEGILSSHFIPNINNAKGVIYSTTSNICLYPTDNSITTTTQFKDWLSSNNVIVYYPLATPTNTEITDTDLINQLENATYSDETITEDYLKDTNVVFKEQYGPVNTVVLSRSGGADKIYKCYPEDLPDDEKIAIEIADNQIMNGNDRDEYLDNIFTQLYGLQFYLNDFSSTGVAYLDLCDRYNVEIDENLYSCVMLNDELNVTQGVEEIIHTERLEESLTDYSKSDKTDRKINQTNLIVDKQQGEIDALVESTHDLTDYINIVEGDSEITLTETMDSNGAINYVEITGFSPLNLYPDMGYPGDNIYPNEMTVYTIITQNDDNYNETYVDLGIQLVSTDKLIIEPTKIKVIRSGSTITVDNLAFVFKTFDGSTKMSIKYFDDAHIKCKYIKKNDFTTQFATQAELSSSLTITNSMISSKVSKAEVVSEINQSAEEVQIKANKISLEGLVTANENFKILEDGSIESKNGKFSGIIDGGNIRVNGDGNQITEYNPFIEVYTTKPDIWGNVGSAGIFMYETGMSAYNYDNNNYDDPRIRAENSNGYAELYGHVVNAFGFNNVSLAERKKNFEKFNNGLGLIKDTDIYKFNYNGENDDSKKHIGLVIGDNYNYSKEITNKENDAVDLYSMVGVCFEAIKEQQEIIESLQDEIKKLKEAR